MEALIGLPVALLVIAATAWWLYWTHQRPLTAGQYVARELLADFMRLGPWQTSAGIQRQMAYIRALEALVP